MHLSECYAKLEPEEQNLLAHAYEIFAELSEESFARCEEDCVAREQLREAS